MNKIDHEMQSFAMPLADIQLIIEETINIIKHLNRSNIELKEIVIEDPDVEFVLAIEENETIILNKKGLLIELLNELKIQDITSANTYESSIVALGIELELELKLGNTSGSGATSQINQINGIEVNREVEVHVSNSVSNSIGIHNNIATDSNHDNINEVEVEVDDLDSQMLPTSVDAVHDTRDRDGMYL